MRAPEQAPITHIVDTDPGVDDAVAILLAAAVLKNPAFIATYGNASTEQTGKNLRYLTDFIKDNRKVSTEKPILMFSGIDRALYDRKPYDRLVDFVHGEDAMEGLAHGSVPITEKSGVIYQRVEKQEKKVDVYSFGAPTEIRNMLKRPDIRTKIKSITIMGGTISAQGNTGAHQEANFRHDPRALKEIIKIANENNIPITIVPLDLSEVEGLQFTPKKAKELVRSLKAKGSEKVANLIDTLVGSHSTYSTRYRKVGGARNMHADLPTKTKYKGAPIHDLTALMVRLHPELFQIGTYTIEVQDKNRAFDFDHDVSAGVIGITKDYMPNAGKVKLAMALKPGAAEKYWQLVEDYLAKYYT